MKKLFCVICQKEHTSEKHWGWRHKKWTNPRTGEIREGWGHVDKPMKHFNIFTPDRILEDRKKHEKDVLQPYRDGEFSKEFRDEYPDVAKDMVKEGVITKQQHDSAKDVWK